MSNKKSRVIASDLNQGASILDAMGDDDYSTLESLSSKKEEAEAEATNVEAFVPTEEAIPFSAFVQPAKVEHTINILKVSVAKHRLGLEQTQEQYVAFPGTSQRWTPLKVGNAYRTGLDREELAPTPEERKKRIKELEAHFGKPLDNAFYADMSFRIDPNKKKGEKLYLNDPYDLVVYLAMLESPLIANGIHEYRNGTKPTAEWYLEDKEAEIEEKAKRRSVKEEAIRTFGELSLLKKRKIAVILALDVNGLTDRAAGEVLWDYIEDHTAPANIAKFLNVVKKGDTFISVYEMVVQAISFNILSRRTTGDIYYGDEFIGSTTEVVVSKLMSTQHASLRLGIKTKLELKYKQ